MEERRIYNEEAINNWKALLDNIPERIEYWQHLRINPRAKLAELKPELAALEVLKIAPTHVKLESLQAQIDVLKIPAQMTILQQKCDDLQNQMKELEDDLQNLSAKLMPVNVEWAELTALIAIKDAQLCIETLNPQLMAHQNQLAFLQPQLISSYSAIQAAQEQSLELQRRLAILENEDAVDRMHHEHERYHHHHHHHQEHCEVRVCVTPGDRLLANLGDVVGDMYRSSAIAGLKNECQILHSKLAQQKQHQNYLQAEIHRHQHETSTLQNKMTYAVNQLNCYDKKQKDSASQEGYISLRARLAACSNLKTSLEEQRYSIQNKINKNRQDNNFSQSQIENLQSKLNNIRSLAQPYSDNNNIQDLQTKLRKEKIIQGNFQAEKDRLKREISYHIAEIAKAESNIQDIKSQEASLLSNHFLVKLWFYPAYLFNHLVQSLKSHLEDYDNNYPANQSAEVRICLMQLNEKIAYIENSVLDDVGAMRIKYYQLVGFAHSMLQKCEATSDYILFAEKIKLALGDNTLEAVNALSEYNKLHLPEMSVQELYENEELLFSHMKNEFDGALENVKAKGFLEIHRIGCDLSRIIESKHSSSELDSKYLITTLKKADALARDHSNKELQQDFKNLLPHNKDGKSSRCKKLLGALTLFLGAAMTGVCVAAKFMTFGLSAPLTTPGIIVGSALMLTGLGIFRSGMRKGSSKQMSNFVKAAERGKQTPITEKSPMLFSPYTPVSHGRYSELYIPGGIQPSAPSL
ncbi:MAG: hypothetical protein P4M12_04780 [Gammaproteobacteria bacterium]|nr:hypothetical protein [Gammaproteobacteria bacterium]